ncbi:MAG TPA: hypothetical protein VL500_01615 [Candidatus Eisenbacteria bacterium]|nr:hypothetical protein [Candidatus Eisenbacteria bacterium]
MPREGDDAVEMATLDLCDEDIATDDETGLRIVVGHPIDLPNLVAEKRTEIDLVVSAHAAEDTTPKDAIDSLEMSVATAFLNLGKDMGPEQVRVVSGGELCRFASQLPRSIALDALAGMEAAAAQALLAELAEPTGDTLFMILGERLRSIIGHDGCRELSGIIAREITVPLMARRTWLADHFGDRLWRSYHEALCLHIGFTLAGRRADADLVAPFVQYFRNGNFPVGTLKDGTFLVITA